MKVRDVYEKNSGFVDKVLETDSIEKVIEVMAEKRKSFRDKCSYENFYGA